MGSPHLLGLGFLLLAVAAPHPNIAVGSDHLAERTHVSSSGKTSVTVYFCEDCAINQCESGRFERFVKLAETEDKVFSNEIFDLETRETDILLCFQQAHAFPEGICGIFWRKTGGLGHSCTILNSTENGRGSSSTEENKICCEADTNVWKSNPKLKCYTEMSGAESRKSTADNPGNPEFPTSNILLTLLLLPVLCAAVVAVYCYQRRWISKVLQIVGNTDKLPMERATHV